MKVVGDRAVIRRQPIELRWEAEIQAKLARFGEVQNHVLSLTIPGHIANVSERDSNTLTASFHKEGITIIKHFV